MDEAHHARAPSFVIIGVVLSLVLGYVMRHGWQTARYAPSTTCTYDPNSGQAPRVCGDTMSAALPADLTDPFPTRDRPGKSGKERSRSASASSAACVRR